MAHPTNNCTTLAAPGPRITKPTGKHHSTTTTTTTSTTIYNLTKLLSKSSIIEPTSSHKNPKMIERQVLESGYNNKSLVVDVLDEKKARNLGSIPCRNTFGERQSRASTTTLEKKIERQVLESGYNKSLVVEEKKGQNLGSIPCRNPLRERESGASTTKLEKRGSFNDVRVVELSDFLLANWAKVVSVDMPSFLQIHAVGFARKVKDSLDKFNAKTLALSLKKEFDGAYGPAWHCIVGNSFGSFVTHSVGGFLYFSLDHKVYILLFKTTVRRAY